MQILSYFFLMAVFAFKLSFYAFSLFLTLLGMQQCFAMWKGKHCILVKLHWFARCAVFWDCPITVVLSCWCWAVQITLFGGGKLWERRVGQDGIRFRRFLSWEGREFFIHNWNILLSLSILDYKDFKIKTRCVKQVVLKS